LSANHILAAAAPHPNTMACNPGPAKLGYRQATKHLGYVGKNANDKVSSIQYLDSFFSLY